MRNTVIAAENLTKEYRLGQIGTGTLSHDLNVWWAKVRGKPNPTLKIGERDLGNREGETILALKDVSFTVEQGEALGIIGRNGAGKSTLLKILSRVTAPTIGRVKVRGHIASLLEVGTGFHPDLTGRENIYLNGAILGMTRQEVRRKLDEIVDFAEIEQFIDTPVKRYSSGMYVRLAFAVAAHLDPEILVVDEVLAVGDAAFQKKCLGKLGNVADEGRTVLFVSHNMVAVQKLCRRALWIDKGRIEQDGEIRQVVTNYLQSAGNDSLVNDRVWNEKGSAPGNQMVRLHRVYLHPKNGSASSLITTHTPVVMDFEYWNIQPDIFLDINILVLNQDGVIVFEDGSIIHKTLGKEHLLKPGLFRSECTIPGDLFNTGLYYVRLFFGKDSKYVIYALEDALTFEVHDSPDLRDGSLGKIHGVVRPSLQWRAFEIEDHGK
jgi:lipopolysaccharide transport system ATP-binding protein